MLRVRSGEGGVVLTDDVAGLTGELGHAEEGEHPGTNTPLKAGQLEHARPTTRAALALSTFPPVSAPALNRGALALPAYLFGLFQAVTELNLELNLETAVIIGYSPK